MSYLVSVVHGLRLPMRFETSSALARFCYDGVELRFRSVDPGDHILRIMQRTETFYEIDVLERIRGQVVGAGSGAAIDAGAFIGTHSVYFSKFCGCTPVLSFEANPAAFSILQANLRENHADEGIVAVNKALGATIGRGKLVLGTQDNLGSSRVQHEDHGPTEITTIDHEVSLRKDSIREVALIKIDVEGLEPEVLKGATRTIREHRPTLCIEIHTRRNLLSVLSLLDSARYMIVDCLGFSPTYMIVPTNSSRIRCAIANTLWVIRASFRKGRTASYLYKLARIFSA